MHFVSMVHGHFGTFCATKKGFGVSQHLSLSCCCEGDLSTYVYLGTNL